MPTDEEWSDAEADGFVPGEPNKRLIIPDSELVGQLTKRVKVLETRLNEVMKSNPGSEAEISVMRDLRDTRTRLTECQTRLNARN